MTKEKISVNQSNQLHQWSKNTHSIFKQSKSNVKMLKLFKEQNMLEQLDQLIRQKATGTPEHLAGRLKMSERDLYRVLAELRAKGLKIKYCKRRRCYYYEVETFLKFYTCVVEDGKERRIMGGENNFNNFENNFQTAEFWQYGRSPLCRLTNSERQNDASGFSFWGFGD